MTDPREIVSERVKVTCTLCRRRRKPEAMTGTLCTDRCGCLKAMGRRLSAKALTGAEREAARLKREGWKR